MDERDAAGTLPGGRRENHDSDLSTRTSAELRADLEALIGGGLSAARPVRVQSPRARQPWPRPMLVAMVLAWSWLGIATLDD